MGRVPGYMGESYFLGGVLGCVEGLGTWEGISVCGGSWALGRFLHSG